MWRNIGVAATVAAFLAGTANRGYAQGPGGAVGGGTSAAIRDDLHHIESEVLTTFRQRLAEERAARTDAQRLYLAAIRQIVRFLRAERAPAMPGGPAARSAEAFEP
jgi:F-type H+-transporting ATPase subunit epsilon